MDRIDVVSYGADPTGSTDSSDAFAAAIKDALASGGCVYIPPGSYLLVD